MAAFPGRALQGVALSLILALSGTAGAADYKEAPGLSELVKGGKLPPVEQRLPEKPLVLNPIEKAGKYGGTWRQALMGGSDSLIERSVGYTRLVRWNRDWTAVEPDVAEKVDVKPDGTEYVFHLRKGTRWSDGAPFTADDLVFWYQDVLMNKELTPSAPRWLRSGNDPVIVEKIDDFTVRFRTSKPADLKQHNCLFYSRAHANIWSFFRQGKAQHVPVDGSFCANSGPALLTAGLRGLGIIRLSSFHVHEAIADGRLVPLLTNYQGDDQAVYIVYQSRKFQPLKVRTFIDFLTMHLRSSCDWKAL